MPPKPTKGRTSPTVELAACTRGFHGLVPPVRESGGSDGVNLHALVLLAGVLPVLVFENSELTETLPQPSVAGIEQSQLLEVGHDLGEQHLAELALHRRVEHDLAGRLHRDSGPLPDLLGQEPVAHPHGGLVAELLALANLVRAQIL